MRREEGFSFIELAVVTAIFAILAAIAVPQYSMYKQRSYTNTAATDLRNIAAAEEAYFAQNGSYLPISSCGAPSTTEKCAVSGLPGVTSLSEGIAVTVEATASGFTGSAKHVRGNSVCLWDSAQGGMQGCSTVQ